MDRQGAGTFPNPERNGTDVSRLLKHSLMTRAMEGAVADRARKCLIRQTTSETFVATGLFISSAPDAGLLSRASLILAGAEASGTPVRVVFLFAEAARLASPAGLPEGLVPAALAFGDLCRRASSSRLVCQSALERLDLDADPASSFTVGTLGQWFDLLHDLDDIRSLGA